MLYYIYIGNGQTAIDHLSKVTDGMFVTVSCADKAAVIIDGIRERYNTSILYEQTDPGKDCLDIACLHRRFPRVYITLITEGLQAEERKAYLLAGVSNTLPPQADAESIRSMTRFLQIRQKHKMQEFSRTHRKMLNTFHLPAWKRRIIRRMRIGTPFSAAHRHSRRHPSREQRQGHLQVATCRQ